MEVEVLLIDYLMHVQISLTCHWSAGFYCYSAEVWTASACQTPMMLNTAVVRNVKVIVALRSVSY